MKEIYVVCFFVVLLILDHHIFEKSHLTPMYILYNQNSNPVASISALMSSDHLSITAFSTIKHENDLKVKFLLSLHHLWADFWTYLYIPVVKYLNSRCLMCNVLFPSVYRHYGSSAICGLGI